MSENNEGTDEELKNIREKKLAELKYQANHTGAPDRALDTGGQVLLLSVLNFWELVQKYRKLVIECYADWCRPCKAIEPILQRLATAHTEILFAKLDIDQSAVIAEQFHVEGVPTILFFKDGGLVDRTAGVLPIKQLEAHIRKFLT